MKQLINELTRHRTLSRQQAREALVSLASGAFNPSQAVAFMTVYMMRTITVEELTGFRDAMLEMCHAVKLDMPVMDVCGTGGDGKNTFNISTLSAFVVAAAGQPVAKHGNYGVSSACGSSNVLEHFGCTFTNDKDRLKRSLEAANICVMHAPLFHPAMKNVAPYRKELGVKTFFNMLGPLVNPAFPEIQMSGVFSLELARMYGYLLQQTGGRYAVLHTLDGYDEITLTSPVKCYNQHGEQFWTPDDWPSGTLEQSALGGGDTVEASAAIFRQVLEGKGTQAQQAVVVANASVALHTALEISWEEAIDRADEALKSGKAKQAFQHFLEVNK